MNNGILKPKAGCFAIYELSEEGWEDADGLLKGFCSSLEACGLEVLAAPEHVTDEASCKRAAEFFYLHRVDLICPLIITWCHDHYIWQMQKSAGVPVAVRALPGILNGSALGAQQVGCILEDLDIPHRLYYAEAGDGAEAAKLARFAGACALKNALSGARIAMTGRRTPGMTPTAFDEVEIMRLFGCQVVTYGMDEITAMGLQADDGEVRELWAKVSGAAAAVRDVKPGDELSAIRYYLALKKLAADCGFDAVTVGCYPNYCGKTCLPVSMLIDDGIPAGCEGDLNSTIAMLILQKLTGKPVHFGEMCVVDREENYILSSHCGAAPASLADGKGYILCPVRLAHTGVCIRYSSMPGKVTYMNLVGRKNKYRMCAFKGQAVETPLVYEGNPMKIVPDAGAARVWETVAEYGFGHHWTAVYADVAGELEEFCRLTGIEGVFV